LLVTAPRYQDVILEKGEHLLNYHDLKSIISAKKTTFTMSAPTTSFYVVPNQERPYIEPTFTKQDFDEAPRFLLITAVGASGKSALASKLSRDTGLPVLDLGSHPPVADNTLTGLLTTSFPLEQLSNILTSLKSGAYGVIIDGIDEGRSKVNELAFNAFLEDLIKLSAGSSKASFVLLGRTQALLDCWIYLQEKGINVGLTSIDPFSQERAVRYINTFADPPVLGQRAHYDATRDSILSKLANAFSGEAPNYLSFIGYPPVLDAIATLLREEKNYFRLSDSLKDEGANEIEAHLLFKIASYILDRERLEKVLPNVVKGLLTEFPQSEQAKIESVAFGSEEQAARLIAHSLKLPYEMEVIPQPGLNARYEERLASFVAEHPFLVGGGREFRNAIFEAICLAILIAGGKSRHATLVNKYAKGRRSNLYLIQMLNQVAPGCSVDPSIAHVLIGAALEYRSVKSKAEITIEPCLPIDEDTDLFEMDGNIDLDILMEVISSDSDEPDKKFNFKFRIKGEDTVLLGPRLSACFIEIPCEVTLSGSDELELTAPVEISARKISLLSTGLVVRAQPKSSEKDVILQAREIASSLTSLPVESGVEFAVRVTRNANLHYPLVKYVEKAETLPTTGGVKAKHLKLRKILTHFRSHSRGTMAKLRAKVENERVAGNDVGRPVLERLVKDGVLIPSGKFYFLEPAKVDQLLGVSWMRLKEGVINQKLVEYLQSIG
jgi:hypothetical protein